MSATILLADDSLTIQKVVELTFADTDHDIVTVSSGEELLGKLDEVGPDLVICDVIMPGTDGYEVCQSIKSRPATLHIPVVLLTGTFEPFDRDRALAAGADDIITKPFEAKRLVDAVEKLLAGRTEPVATEPAAATVMTFEGEVPPPVFEEGDGLDFTTTGFDEMAAAGEAQMDQAQVLGEAPDEGLEMSVAAAPPESPSSGEASENFAGAEEPFGDDAEEAEATASGAEPADSSAENVEETDLVDEPLDEPEGASGEAEQRAAEPTGGEEAGSAGEPEPAAEETEAPEEPDLAQPPEPAPAPPAPPEAFVDASEKPAPEAGDPPTAPPTEPAPTTTLSDEDVERIARRVVELASGTLERIAWEVIPDMAELVVRERVRQLEAEIEREQDETPH